MIGLETCPSCYGVIGRDCWNPGECAEITSQMYAEEQRREEFIQAQAEIIDRFAFVDGEGQWRFRDQVGPYELIEALNAPGGEVAQ